MYQTILGSGSAIANELALELLNYTKNVRLVSRSPKAVNGNENLIGADLLNKEQTFDAIKGSSVVYLVAGLTFTTKTWQEGWPLVMQNVIESCKHHNAKLVFLDNVYMYGKVTTPMDEATPYNPCSTKGEARAKTATILEDAIKNKQINAIIARSADFYGYGATKTLAIPLIFEKLKNNSTALWFCNANFPHSLTYTSDIVKALATLGNDEHAYNQTWHLPTDPQPINAKEFIEMVAQEYGVKTKYTVLPKWMVKMLGFFDPNTKEMYEMLYQYQAPYLFDSSKFDQKYFKATPYQEAIKQIVQKN